MIRWLAVLLLPACGTHTEESRFSGHGLEIIGLEEYGEASPPPLPVSWDEITRAMDAEVNAFALTHPSISVLEVWTAARGLRYDLVDSTEFLDVHGNAVAVDFITGTNIMRLALWSGAWGGRPLVPALPEGLALWFGVKP